MTNAFHAALPKLRDPSAISTAPLISAPTAGMLFP
jgi:hypothetical protein